MMLNENGKLGHDKLYFDTSNENLKKLKHIIQTQIDETLCNGIKEVDVHQFFLDIAYEWWQHTSNTSYHDMLNHFEEYYSEFFSLMINTGKLNQQVCNGGFLQYYDNGYADGLPSMYDRDFSHPLTKKILILLPKAIDQFGETLMDEDKIIVIKFLDILKRFRIASIERDKTYIEYESYEDDDGNLIDEEYEESNPDYGMFTNEGRKELNKLDSEYYDINDDLLIIYLKLINNFLKEIEY